MPIPIYISLGQSELTATSPIIPVFKALWLNRIKKEDKEAIENGTLNPSKTTTRVR